jgi:hypothetical protein
MIMMMIMMMMIIIIIIITKARSHRVYKTRQNIARIFRG